MQIGRSAGRNRAHVADLNSCHRAFPTSGQEAGTLGRLHGFGSVRGPEFLVDVLDVGLHRWTTDAKVVADRGERLMRWEERENGVSVGVRWTTVGAVLLRNALG